MLVEPTESESKEEIDRFCDAMISIRREAEDVIQGKQPKDDNLLKNAPHPIAVLTEDNWDKPYSRQQAVYPVPELKKKKFWTTVTRIDDGEFGIVFFSFPQEPRSDMFPRRSLR